MAKFYRSKNGDMVDQVCQQHYGSLVPLPDVFAANAGLADFGPILPSGVVIRLPEVQLPAQGAAVRLWD